MGDKFLDRLAEIRDAQGRDPMPDPSRIEGFGPGHPPAPMELPPTPDFGEVFTGDEDPDQWDAPEGQTHSEPEVAVRRISPMVPVAVQRPPTPPVLPVNPVVPPMDLSSLELVVIEQEAYFRGHSVRLTLEEKAAVANLVLAAIGRELDDYRAQIRGVTEAKPMVITATYNEPVKRKRGRPRKNA